MSESVINTENNIAKDDNLYEIKKKLKQYSSIEKDVRFELNFY